MAAGLARVPSCYYHHLILKNKNGLSASVAVPTSLKKMVTNAAAAAASSSINHGEYRSIAERVSLEKEIKKSKFIAIAAPISDEESAFRLPLRGERPAQSHGRCHPLFWRAYGGVTSECLRNAPTCLVKSKVPMAVEVPFDLLGLVQHQLQHFQVEDIEQDYETGKDGFAMVSFKVDFDQVEKLENAVKANCSRQLVFYKSVT
ncbi:IMPACT FAMILY MEMBER YIGZ [Salix purpurea]|uniref:IMPACT FAMILY MEMBER YIGZ n=1 Tax=Salix purpurea TaxID=77065 RepID=A0A9Q0V275_SALPP|nr:IMPACT FAMILY MEMBER YIGZ [Salix purpurea]